jgi:hypothetical protein
MEPNNSKVLFEKDNMKFTKITDKKYCMTFSIENQNIILANVIDVNLIKLIYDLNPDVYESVLLEKINEDESIVTLLLKHFFEDLGLPQKYSYLHIKKTCTNDTIIFNSQSIKTTRPKNMPTNAVRVAMKENIGICEIITPHKVNFTFTVLFEDTVTIPAFMEKMIGVILNKTFKRVKQFIENITIK